MRAYVLSTILLCLALTACGKPSERRATSTDPCANAKGASGYETDAQAIAACRASKNFSGPDVKRSHIQITNH